MKPMEPLQFKDLDQWWPQSFGLPTTAGGQSDLQYAYFKDVRRLLVRRGGEIITYDTGDHEIHGVSQDSETRKPRFSSGGGDVDLTQFRRL